MNRLHRYKATISWTGNKGRGTADYKSYSRDHAIFMEGKPVIGGSSDPVSREINQNILRKIFWYHPFRDAICFGIYISVR